jgi:endonuclease-8
VREVSDDEALAIVRATRPGMQQSALDGMQDAHRVIYARAGRPCPRCGAPIRSRGQGDDNRITYWCAGCQT